MAITTNKSPMRTINVRVPEAVFQQLDEIAKATEQTRSFIALTALSSYLQEQNWQIRDIEMGIAEAERGEFATDEEVKAVFAKYGA
jgi:predicted transcriptional regulator